MELLVIVIVLLVVAIVVLAIFTTGILNIGPWIDVSANCMNMGSSVCRSMGVLPPTWSTQKMRYGNQMQTCEQITGIKDCSGFGIPKCPGTCKDKCDLATETQVPPNQGTCDIGKVCCKKK